MARQADWAGRGVDVSLAQRINAWMAPFFSQPVPDVQRQEQQQRETTRLLRQLRAELLLMRRWRNDDREGRQ